MELDEKLKLHVHDLGLIEYDHAFALQKQYVESLLHGGEQSLLLCEHPAVITLGRLAKREHILVSSEILDRQNVAVREIDRGGDITLHAPGQLVLYPILELSNYGKDLHKYMRTLEQVAIDLFNDFGIVASRISGQTGVWVDREKIASLGIGVRKWVSFHGLSINVNTDLSLYSLIKPCGLDIQMTSIAKITERPAQMEDIKHKIIRCFHHNFNTGSDIDA